MKTIEELKEENEKLQEENKQLIKENDELEDKNIDLLEDINNLENDRDELQDELDTYKDYDVIHERLCDIAIEMLSIGEERRSIFNYKGNTVYLFIEK